MPEDRKVVLVDDGTTIYSASAVAAKASRLGVPAVAKDLGVAESTVYVFLKRNGWTQQTQWTKAEPSQPLDAPDDQILPAPETDLSEGEYHEDTREAVDTRDLGEPLEVPDV